MGRRFPAHGAAQLEIVAEDLGVAHLELGQGAGLALAFEHGFQGGLAVVRQFDELVQGLVVALAEEPSLGDDRWQGVGQGPGEQVVHVVQVVPLFEQAVQQGRAFVHGFEVATHARQFRQGRAQGPEVLGGGAVDHDARAQALQVVDPVQGGAQALAAVVAFEEEAHEVLDGQDGGQVLEGLVQAGGQEASAHGRLGLVQDVPQGAAALAAVHGPEKLQVAFGDLVQKQGGGQVQGREGGQVPQVAFLGQLQVGQKRPAAARQGRLVVQVQGGQGSHALGAQDLFFCAAGVEIRLGGKAGNPGLPVLQVPGQGLGVRQQEFARVHLDQPLPEHGFVSGLQAAPDARGEIHPGQAAAQVRVPEQGAQEVVPLGVEVDVLHHGAGREHAGHLAFDQALGLLGVLDLVAQGHLVALVQELAQVLVDGVVGHAAHGHGVLGAGVAAGQGDLQLPGRGLGVLEEELEEIAHAEEHKGVRVLFLDPQVLLHHGSEFDRAHDASSVSS